MSGSFASRSGATWPSAVGISPLRQTWQASSVSKDRRCRMRVSLMLKAYHVMVLGLRCRQGPAGFVEPPVLGVLAGLGFERGEQSGFHGRAGPFVRERSCVSAIQDRWPAAWFTSGVGHGPDLARGVGDEIGEQGPGG